MTTQPSENLLPCPHGLTYSGRAVRFLVDKLQKHYHFTDQECNRIAKAALASTPDSAQHRDLGINQPTPPHKGCRENPTEDANCVNAEPEKTTFPVETPPSTDRKSP
jgi:hypothetical protein